MADHDPTAPTEPPRRPIRPGVALLVGLLVALVGMALSPGAIDNIDTRICFRSAQSVLSNGTFALEDPTPLETEFLWTGRGTDGAVYSKFGAGETVTLLPFVATGRALAVLSGMERDLLEELLAALSSAVFTGIAAAFLVLIGTGHLGVSPRAAAVGALAWAFGTYQFAYAGSSYLETPLALCVVMAAWAGLEARRSRSPWLPITAGFFTAWAVAIKVAMIVYLPFLLIPLLTTDRKDLLRRGALAGIPLAMTALWLMLLNHLRYGSPFSTGYVSFGTLFETPLATGLGGYAFDPDLALLLFAPAFGLALFGLPELRRRSRPLFWTALGVFASGTIIHALHTGYHGGTCYGPRYLISAIPLITAAGVALVWERARARVAVVCLLGVFVILQLPGVLVSPLEYHTLRGTMRTRGAALDSISPRFPNDWRLLGKKLAGDTDRYDLAEFANDPAAAPLDTDYAVPRMDRGLSIWWLLAYAEGLRIALVPGLGLLAGAAGCVVLLGRRLRAG